MSSRIGVDVGGTFTDLIYYDENGGDVLVAKVPTTPAAPEEGVADAVAAALTAENLCAASYFLHGTTVGLNSLLTRTGAVVGLLTTRGFRDVLEIRRGDHGEPYNVLWRQPEPLVPRRLRLPVTERVLFDGSVDIPLAEDEIRDAVSVFRAEGVTSVAVVFLHAYANPQHELAAAAALRRFGFDGGISLSHEISGEYREYERTSTTVIDAYVRPRMEQYLSALGQRLADVGFGGSLMVTRSGGGALTFDDAAQRPFETIMSGPVAGVLGAAELARALAIPAVITADVGGTSFDTALVVNGEAPVMYEGMIEGFPVQAPWVDVRSIGAGGGSLALVDAGSLLRVGPQSAGADPGPACYGRGGTRPTVTDAALLLGMLGDGSLTRGFRLDRVAATRAVEQLAGPLGLSVEDAAKGVVAIASAAMANAIREITVERGIDPRGCALIAFGGAGPMFATLLARDLGIREILVPGHAGNFSAWGLLGADIVRTAARTHVARLDDTVISEGNRVLDDLFGRLRARSSHDAEADREVVLDLRYQGQEYALSVPVPAPEGRIALSSDDISKRFSLQYEQAFGHTIDEPIEVAAFRAALRTPLPRRALRFAATSAHGSKGGDSISAWSFTRQAWIEFALLDRSTIVEGIDGPAILLEPTATTYLDAGHRAHVHESGALRIERQAST